MKFKRLKKESLRRVDEATEGEAMITEDIFKVVSKIAGYDVWFSDIENELFLTDIVNNVQYTITVKQDE